MVDLDRFEKIASSRREIDVQRWQPYPGFELVYTVALPIERAHGRSRAAPAMASAQYEQRLGAQPFTDLLEYRRWNKGLHYIVEPNRRDRPARLKTWSGSTRVIITTDNCTDVRLTHEYRIGVNIRSEGRSAFAQCSRSGSFVTTPGWVCGSLAKILLRGNSLGIAHFVFPRVWPLVRLSGLGPGLLLLVGRRSGRVNSGIGPTRSARFRIAWRVRFRRLSHSLTHTAPPILSRPTIKPACTSPMITLLAVTLSKPSLTPAGLVRNGLGFAIAVGSGGSG